MQSRPLRILVGEDESVTALGLQQDLRSLGHSVIGIAPDGLTAVSMANALGPDLVILDVKMPHLGGMEAAERIHAARPVPIIIVTAYSDAETLGKATSAPVFHYLVKPVSAQQLGAAIAVAQARHQEWDEQRRETNQLRQKLDERKVIERAKGLLMEREGVSESAAYKILQRTSQSRNISMAELSKSLLAAEDLVRPPVARPALSTRERGRHPGE
ncbi:MAG TPA: response regulator [Gemmatimonadaceae bacterium]|nr:response regulator [Gemmatimonadaceae bacterium]